MLSFSANCPGFRESGAALWHLSLENNLKESRTQRRGCGVGGTPCVQAGRRWGKVPVGWVAGLVGWIGEKEEMVERWGTSQGGNCKRALSLKTVVGNSHLFGTQPSCWHLVLTQAAVD